MYIRIGQCKYKIRLHVMYSVILICSISKICFGFALQRRAPFLLSLFEYREEPQENLCETIGIRDVPVQGMTA